jgi:hypothetical protein
MDKNPEAVKLGARGGNARWKDTTKKERSDYARKMVAAREAKRKIDKLNKVIPK